MLLGSRTLAIVYLAFAIQLASGGQVPGVAIRNALLPPKGYVFSSSAAIGIAKAVAEAKLGESTLRKVRRYRARLSGQRWFVTGRSASGRQVLLVVLSKADGEIFRIEP